MNEDIDKIVNDLKARGVFDEFRKECLSVIDTRPAFESLRQRIDIMVKSFFDEETWTSSAIKNQLREKLRKKLTQSDTIKNTINNLVNQVVEPTYMLSRIDKHVQDYLGIKVEDPLLRVEENVIAWPEDEKVEVKKEDTKWSQGNWNEVSKPEGKSANPSLSPSTVSSHSLSPPTPEPITDGASEDSFPAAPSPTSLISGENSKSSQHYFDESTSKSPENKTKNDIWNQLSKEGKQSADEPKPEPLDWGTNTLPPPARPFAHLGSSAGLPTVDAAPTEDPSVTIKSEPKSPELPSSSSSVPLISNKSKEESREEISEVEESKGKSEPIVSDMLSDVSSAHTSDLSDFDDAMSISSIEEAEEIIKGVDNTESKVIKSEEKVQETKIKQENDPVPQADELIKNIKVENADQMEVQPKFEIFKSTPEAPVFDIRARGKETNCIPQKKSEEQAKSKEMVSTSAIRSRNTSQRYDEADLYKPRYTIPGGSRRNRSSNVK